MIIDELKIFEKELSMNDLQRFQQVILIPMKSQVELRNI